MKYAWLVALREFAENVKTKGFWVGVLLFPLLLWASIQVPRFLSEKVVPTRHFLVVDQTGEFDDVIQTAIERHHAKRVMAEVVKYGAANAKHKKKTTAKDLESVPAPDLQPGQKMLDEMAEARPEMVDAFLAKGGLEVALRGLRGVIVDDAPEFVEPRQLFVPVRKLPDGVDADAEPEVIKDAMTPYLLGNKMLAIGEEEKELFALIIIPEDADRMLRKPGQPLTMIKNDPLKGVQYWSTNLADTNLKNVIERAINKEVRRREYVDKGIDTAKVRAIESTRIAFTALDPKKAKGEEQVSAADTIRQWAPIGFVYLLFVALMTVAQMLLNNTVEEKSNRIIEVLLSSVTPNELMTGKLLGIAGVGMLMLGTWIISIVAVLGFMAGPEVEWAGLVFDVVRTSGLLWFFMVYFLLGYLLYAGIFLAIGSICGTLKEAQNFLGPVMLVMMVPLLAMVFIPKDPHGTLATVLTWIPIYTPFVMMNRAAADPPMFDVIGSGLLLVVSIIAVLWGSGKIFRLAILRTGQPPKLLELFRWLRS